MLWVVAIVETFLWLFIGKLHKVLRLVCEAIGKDIDDYLAL